MGMFDRVEFDSSINLPEFEDGEMKHEWRTKEFSREMKTYRVTEMGKLLEEEYHTEAVPKEERPFPDADESSLRSIFGSVRWITDGWAEKKFDGVMKVVGSTDDFFYEYNLKFTDGTLEEIRLVEKSENAN